VPVLEDVSRQIRWQDIVDVLVLTIVLFRLTIWLRGTVALQVLAGMLALAAAAFAADQIGLLLTAYVLRALGAVATLVVVVVFRNEIRRGLSQVNPLRLWRDRRAGARVQPPATADVLAQAAVELARQRIGAILVVQCSDPLDEHLTGGVALDALPSTELLEAIFHPTSPIHDGAAVVENGRLARAGCFLPLSTSLSLPEGFGSRHRAAAGLSEVCDAAVVTVSEERGAITLFQEDRLDRMDTAAELAGRLGGSAARFPSAGRGTRARARLLDAVALFGILFLVVGAWYAIVGEPGIVVTHTVSIELRGVPGELQADPPVPDRVAIHLRGPRARLDGVQGADLEAWVDLTGAQAGRRRRSVEAAAPAGIEITEIVPPSVAVRIRPRR
jgi:diadenylate cyclase